MKRSKKFTVVSFAITAILGITSASQAQFSFGGVSFGSRGPSGIRGQMQNISRFTPSGIRQTADLPPRGPGYTIGSGRFRFTVDPTEFVGRPPVSTYPVQPPRCVTPVPVVGPAPFEPVIEPPAPVVAPVPLTKEQQALQMTYVAQRHFSEGNYQLATETMNQVLEMSPESAAGYQFRALTHFAQGNYDAAAADVYDTLLRGTLWSWETVYPLYGNVDTYQTQYRSLSRAAREDQDSMSKHFLLAYHHLMLGHLQHGEKELQHVLKIQPNETVTQKLLALVQNLQTQDKVAQR